MKKFGIKILTIILVNIILLFFIFILSDLTIYKLSLLKIEPSKRQYYQIYNNIINPEIDLLLYDFTGKDDYGYGGRFGRKPDGLEFSKQKPIVIFGCSFAFGHYLNYNQTLSYKLAQTLRRPIYNRALAGAGPQHMYYQSTMDDFYNDIPKTDTILYVFIDDHYRRLKGEMFELTDEQLALHYKIKNNKLILDDYDNYLLNFFKQSYTLKAIRHKYKNFYISNHKNADKLTNETVLYFVKTRENLEKKWNNKINFSILFYENIKYEDMLKDKLEANGFRVFKFSDLTSEDLNSDKYKMQDNGHPTEAAWDLLTPKIIEKLGI